VTEVILGPAAIKAGLIAGAIELGRSGARKASATEILAHSGLDITNVVAGQALGQMNLNTGTSSGRKFYYLDPTQLDELQQACESEIPGEIALMPDLTPAIQKIQQATSWLQGQVREQRAKEIQKKLLSDELRSLTSDAAGEFDKTQKIARLQLEISRIKAVQNEAVKAVKEYEALPSLTQVQAELTTATDRLDAAKADMEERKARTKAAETQTARYNQAFIPGHTVPVTAAAVTSAPLPQPKAPWWHKLLP